MCAYRPLPDSSPSTENPGAPRPPRRSPEGLVCRDGPAALPTPTPLRSPWACSGRGRRTSPTSVTSPWWTAAATRGCSRSSACSRCPSSRWPRAAATGPTARRSGSSRRADGSPGDGLQPRRARRRQRDERDLPGQHAAARERVESSPARMLSGSAAGRHPGRLRAVGARGAATTGRRRGASLPALHDVAAEATRPRRAQRGRSGTRREEPADKPDPAQSPLRPPRARRKGRPAAGAQAPPAGPPGIAGMSPRSGPGPQPLTHGSVMIAAPEPLRQGNCKHPAHRPDQAAAGGPTGAPRVPDADRQDGERGARRAARRRQVDRDALQRRVPPAGARGRNSTATRGSASRCRAIRSATTARWSSSPTLAGWPARCTGATWASPSGPAGSWAR